MRSSAVFLAAVWFTLAPSSCGGRNDLAHDPPGRTLTWCEPSQPELDASGRPTGRSVCTDGSIVRKTDQVCTLQHPGDQCSSSADCIAGFICDCGPTVNRCNAADCARQDDCPVDQECLLVEFSQPISKSQCLVIGDYFCSSDADLCRNNADCPAGQSCLFDLEKGRHCVPTSTCSP